MMIVRFFKQLPYLGLKPGFDIADQARLMVINTLCTMALITVVTLCITFSIAGAYSILESLVLLPLLITVLYLNYRERYGIARNVFCYGFLILIFSLAVSDRRTGTEYFLVAGACSSAFVFKQTRCMIVSFTVALSLYALYQFIDFHLPFKPDTSINYPLMSTVLMIISAIIVFIEMIYFRRIVKQYADAVIETNEELNLTNERLDAVVQQRTEELESKNDVLNTTVAEIDKKNQYLDLLTRELKRRNFELDQIIYRLSHNVKAPLSSIMGLTNLMKLDTDEAVREESLSRIERKIEEMEGVFRTLTIFASIVRKEVLPVRLTFNEIVQEAMAGLRGLEAFNDVEINCPHVQEALVSDRSLLVILFQNIIHNSITFRNRKVKAYLNICFEKKGGVTEVMFTDNGMGIDDQVKERIFDMFYRGSEYSKGTGLGLYIVNEIIRKLDGSINLVSRKEETSFRVIIPDFKMPVEQYTNA